MLPERLKLDAFLGDFRTFEEGVRSRERDALGSALQQIGSDMQAIRQRIAAEDRLSAPHFNIFRLLRFERDEVHLHTAFLGELLNPRGSHGQGSLFLRQFFDAAAKHPSFTSPSDPMQEQQWIVQSEVYVGDGNILDLRIENPSLGYIMVVENKIDAGEQRDQLRRYGQWMRTHRGNYQHQQLLFLTLDGRPPESCGDFACTRLSYHEDIASMLKTSIEMVTAVPILALLKQYLDVVEYLTREDTHGEFA